MRLVDGPLLDCFRSLSLCFLVMLSVLENFRDALLRFEKDGMENYQAA